MTERDLQALWPNEWPLYDVYSIGERQFASVDEFNLFRSLDSYPNSSLKDVYSRIMFQMLSYPNRTFVLMNGESGVSVAGLSIQQLSSRVERHPNTCTYRSLYRYCRHCSKVSSVGLVISIQRNVIDHPAIVLQDYLEQTFDRFTDITTRCEHCQQPLGEFPWLHQETLDSIRIQSFHEARAALLRDGWTSFDEKTRWEDSQSTAVTLQDLYDDDEY